MEKTKAKPTTSTNRSKTTDNKSEFKYQDTSNGIQTDNKYEHKYEDTLNVIQINERQVK